MANVGYATLQVIPSLKGFSSRLRLGMGGPLSSEGAKAGDQAGRSFASTFAKVAAAGAVAAGAIGLGKSFVSAAIESQKIGKQTEAVLKSMGGQAGLTAKDVGNLATKLSLQSGVDDEVIQSAQNVLLTFGKVRNEVGKGNDIYNRGSQAALDMSVALKQDLQGATIQVGKALNDPIKGITALSRAGVSFTQQQKDQITTLVKSGKTLDAQKIILSELENQFGGSAKAQATAGDRLKVAFGNLQETLGGYLLPAVEAIAGFLADKLPKAMAFAGKAIGPLISGARQLFGVLFTGDFKGGGPFSEDSPIIDRVFKLRDAIGRFVESFKKVWPQIKAVAGDVLGRLLDATKALVGFLVGKLVPGLVKIGQWVIKHKPVLIGLATAIGVGLVAAFTSWAISAGAAAIATVAAIAPVLLIGAAIAALVAGIIWAYQNWDFFRTAVDAVARFLTQTLWPALKSIASFIVDTVVPAVVTIIEKLVDWGTAAFDVAADVVRFLGGIVTFVTGLPGKLASAAGNLWGWVTGGLEGILNGVLNLFESAINGIIAVINAAIRAYNFLPFHKDVDTLKHVNLGLKATASNAVISSGPNMGKDPHHLAAGGLIWPRAGGVQATIGEGGRTEAVVPLSAAGLRPFAAALAPAIDANRAGMAMNLQVGIDPAGGENAFLSWLLKALRIRPAARSALTG